jgi:hypothetical protein
MMKKAQENVEEKFSQISLHEVQSAMKLFCFYIPQSLFKKPTFGMNNNLVLGLGVPTGRSSNVKSLAFHCRGPSSSPGQVMWHLWWTKWHWDRFPPNSSVSFASHSTDCFALITIHHPCLVQWAKQWPKFRVDSVSLYPMKLKRNKRICAPI